MRVGTAEPPHVSFCRVLEVGASPTRVVGQELIRRGYAAQHRDAVTLDELECAPGLEPLLEHDRGPLQDHRQRAHAERGGVEERRDHQGDVGGDHVVVDQAVQCDPREVLVGEHGSLRPAGRPRGVEDRGRVVEGDVGVGVPAGCRGEQTVQSARTGDDHVRHAGLRDALGHALGELGIVDEHARAGVGEHMGDLGRSESRVDRHEHGTELGARRRAPAGTRDCSRPGTRPGRPCALPDATAAPRRGRCRRRAADR